MADAACEFLARVIEIFRSQKRLAEGAIVQLDDDGLHRALHAETNSVAVIMQHMAGNMRSRWTDFLTADGEKPWRGRDDEFIDGGRDRGAIMADWESGWSALFGAVEGLTQADLERTVLIRGEPHSVPAALIRQVSHYAYHVGQIVQVARVMVGEGAWRTLSIPRGGSAAFNQTMFGSKEPDS
ncbi:MAG: DUF1572 family protein [Phycisphaerales bacterium]|nr:DUF1572 family protein [Phycisphaerales bacterium]